MSSKSSIKEIIPLEPSKDVLSQGDDQIAEQQSANDLVDEKLTSKPRRKILIVVAAVLIFIIVIAVLVGTFVPNHLRIDDEDIQRKKTLTIYRFKSGIMACLSDIMLLFGYSAVYSVVHMTLPASLVHRIIKKTCDILDYSTIIALNLMCLNN